MKSVFVIALFAIAGLQPLVTAEAPRTPPIVTIEAFEPPERECFDLGDKFRQPEIVIAPQIAFPFERRSGPAPRVVVLVQIDEGGFAKRLAVLNSTSELYSRA